MEVAVIVLGAAGLAGIFGYLLGASFLRRGEMRAAHLLMWGSIAGLLVLGMVVRHEWARFLLLAGFILAGQGATELWRLRRERNREARR